MKKAAAAQKNIKGKNLNQKGKRSSGSNRKGLLTKIIKGSKGQKGKNLPFKLFNNFGVEWNQPRLRAGRFVLVALDRARLSARQIEAGRRVIKKAIRKSYKLSVHVYPFSPVTKRPSDVRMGKGKGTKITDWIYPLRAGKVLYEISYRRRRRTFRRLNLYKIRLFRALRLAQTKFAFRTTVRYLAE